MINSNKIFRGIFKTSLLFFSTMILFTACENEATTELKEQSLDPITKAEIIAFQRAYGVSFNGISNAIEDETYYELKAKEHIDEFYNFTEGKVMFKIGHDDEQSFRYSEAGLLSYLIGKNKEYPEDTGMAKENWRKIDWKNFGTIMERDMAIAIGRVTMENEKDLVVQNYTMVLKRNKEGEIKLISHKISIPCD